MKHPWTKKIWLLTAVTSAALIIAGCDDAGPPNEPDQEPLIEKTEKVEPPPAAEDSPPGIGEFDDGFRVLPPVPGTLDELPDGVNIVQYEMRLLTGAMENILRLIGDNRLDEIPGQIGKVHPAYELTHQALEAQLYTPPQNPDQIETFIALDDAFHDDLRALVAAARDDDLQRATDQYSKLVQGCTACHGQFRFP